VITDRPLRVRVARNVALILLVAVFVVPFYLVLLNAFKHQVDVQADPLGIPLERLTLDNFIEALTSPVPSMPSAFLFTATLALTVTFGTVLVGSSLAYVVARSRSRWALLVYPLILAGIIIPPQVIVIPLIKVLVAIGLMNSFPGLLLYEIAARLPLTMLVYVAFIRVVPHELDEAAAIDGAGPFTTFRRIILPLTRPVTVTLCVFLVIFTWNDFFSPLIILGPSGQYTVTTAIYRSVGGQFTVTDWGLIFANVVLVSAPMIALYVVAQRQIVGGLTSGSVRG
jgi:raffinose/stachyose/melibiose transport system permease protein